MYNYNRIFIVSNRLPMTIVSDGEDIIVRASSGGLITAMNSYLKSEASVFTETFWVGCAGCTPPVWEIAMRSIEESNFTYLPVFIYKEQYEKYYNGFSNSVIWPLFHYFPSFAEYNPEHFDHYLLANEHFCETIIRHLRPGDTVWIHDYHLMPLAQMLRNRIPDIAIGFFLHIPFPSYELFRLLPKSWQEHLFL